MRGLLPLPILFILLLPLTQGHGFLETHEAETLVVEDEVGEDSYPWGGYDVWQAYVGEAYNETLDADGVYVRSNQYGAGSVRAPGQGAWTLTYAFTVGDTEYVRTVTDDGATVTSDFEGFEWSVVDGNTLHVKGFVPIPNGTKGLEFRDLTIVSAVDGDPRDLVPGGVSPPGSDQEVPTGDAQYAAQVVPLQGPHGYADVVATDLGAGSYTLGVTNSLGDQGQHVHLRVATVPGWNVTLPERHTLNLDGDGKASFNVTFVVDAAAGTTVPPLRVDVLTDLGGRETFLAALVDGVVVLVPETEPAPTGIVPEVLSEAPGPAAVALVALLGLLAAARRRTRG